MSCDVLEYKNSAQFHDRYYSKNRPVILRGFADHNRLKIFDWSARYFLGVLGAKKVPILKTNTGFLSYERDAVDMPFEEFYAKSFGEDRSTDAYYYFKNPVRLLPDGHDDSDLLPELGPYIRRSLLRNLWMSSTGLTVGLHFDAAENLNFQLRGEKIFMLYPPGVQGFYPLPMFSQTAHISGVFRDGPTPDLKQFPRFDTSKGLAVRVQEGDILYLPAYWWHQVESLGSENVNLNFWWMPAARKQVLNWNQALRGHFQLVLRYLKMGSILKAPAATRSR
jgi:hypothetical protein